ncbi:unnamed protein product, partial [Ectocarpus sp. 13 AM-2016]
MCVLGRCCVCLRACSLRVQTSGVCVSSQKFRFERTSPHGNQILTTEMAAQYSEGCYDQLSAQSIVFPCGLHFQTQ